MAAEIWEGALSPESYELTLSPDVVDGADLSTVTEAVLVVCNPRGVESEWAVSMVYTATPSPKLTLTKIFAATPPSELDTRGTWYVYAKLTAPSGTLRSHPRPLFVHGRFEFVPS